MKKLYISSSPHHLLITLLKQYNSKEPADLILCRTELLDSCVLKQISALNLFDNIFFYSFLEKEPYNFGWKETLLYGKKKLCQDILKRTNLSYSYFLDKDIYIFYDGDFFGYFLNMAQIKYHLIEDGFNCFKHPHSKSFKNKRFFFYHLIEIFLGLSWDFYGKSKYTIDIEVNSASNLVLKGKFVEIPRKKLFQKLTRQNKKEIINLFFPQHNDLTCSTETATLLITQPLSEDHIISHEKKIKLYRYLVSNYAVGTLFIKPHPREKENYAQIFPDAKIIDYPKVPLEIFDLAESFHFKKAITAFSTSIETLNFVDEKVYMGFEWVLKFE